MMPIAKNVIEELERKAETNVKVKSLVADITKIIVNGLVNDEIEIGASTLNHILITSRVNNKYKQKTKVDIGLLKQILFWQYSFYMLNKDTDHELQNIYLQIYRYHTESYESLVKRFGGDTDVIAIPFNVYLSQPKEESFNVLKKFFDATKISIDVYYSMVEVAIRDSGEKGIMPLWVFHKDVIGNEVDWAEKLDYWANCYYVYELYHKEGMTKTNLVKHMQELVAFSSLYLHQKEKGNAIHKVTELLDEAERLILSAKQGTFPI